MAERDRRMHPDVVAALCDAGLFRLLVPVSLGGVGADFATLVDVVDELARVDGSAGWVIMGSPYMPGTLALSGSPCPDVARMTNCALLLSAHAGGIAASARRGSSRKDAGRPVASARRPT